MKLHKVYTCQLGVEQIIDIPDLALVKYHKFKNPERNRLRRFYKNVEEFDTRVTKDDFT